MIKWIPYLIDGEGKRIAPLALPEYPKTLREVQDWFHKLPKEHPHLVGQHIEFEETQDGPARIFVPGGIGGT
jgi:hypothetical protein